MSKRKKRILKHPRQKIVIEATNTGFSAYFKKISVHTTGLSIPEVLANLKEAFEAYVSVKPEELEPGVEAIKSPSNEE